MSEFGHVFVLRSRARRFSRLEVDAVLGSLGGNCLCGYVEYMEAVGVGIINHSILVIAPDEIRQETSRLREERRVIEHDGDFDFASAWLLAVGQDESYWWHPDRPDRLAYYNSSLNLQGSCLFGFRDIRYIDCDGILRWSESRLVHDSQIDVRNQQFAHAAPEGVNPRALLRELSRLLLLPGDVIVGNPQSDEVVTAYFACFRGYMRLQLHEGKCIIAEISYDEHVAAEIPPVLRLLRGFGFQGDT